MTDETREIFLGKEESGQTFINIVAWKILIVTGRESNTQKRLSSLDSSPPLGFDKLT